MKKNITINLFGALYAIDEDAYELLRQYQESMRRYFSRKEGGEEIADDIEHRVAELLAELKAGGTEAVCIEHIQDIIRRIGNPEEVSGEENNDAESRKADKSTAESSSDSKPKGYLGKRLFRDPEDLVFGGVISGLAHYCGATEPIWWRLAIIVITIMFTGLTIPVYIIMWICMPAACTPEDRLRMYGKTVSTSSINEEMMRTVEKVKAGNYPPDNKGCLTRGCAFTMIGCCAFILIPILLMALTISFPLFLLESFFSQSLLLEDMFQNGNVSVYYDDGLNTSLLSLFPNFPNEFGIIAIAALIVIGIPIYVLVRRTFFSNAKPYSRTVRVSLIGVWLTALVLMIALALQ